VFGARIDLQTGRDLALGRVGLALTMLVVTVSDPEQIGFQVEGDDLVAVGYFVFSLFMTTIAVRSWWWQFRLRHVENVIDLAVVVAILFLNDPGGLGKHALELMALTFASFRIGLTTKVGYVLVIGGAYLAVFVLLAFGPILSHSHAHPIYLIVRISMIAVLIGLGIMVMLNHLSVVSVLVPPPPTGSSYGGFFRMANQATKQALKAGRSRIGWQAGEVSLALVADTDQGETGDASADVLWPFPDLVRSQVAAMAYDPARNRALVLYRDHSKEALTDLAVDPAAVFPSRGTIILAPILAVSGSGLLAAEEVPRINPLSLEPIEQIAKDLAVAIDLNDLAYADRQADLTELRKAVALDLHDSVAQSLAGARFWLNGISTRLADERSTQSVAEVRPEIETLAESLAFEQSQIHAMITRLRDGDHEFEMVDVRTVLQQLGLRLAESWRTDVAVVVDRNAAVLPINDAYAAKHLIREAVANAVRHGNASRVDVRVSRGGTDIVIVVIDNGTGLKAELPQQGPWSIRARLYQLGGEVELVSSPAGLRVEMRFPSGGVVSDAHPDRR
jgi:signal transduction histidine kinase